MGKVALNPLAVPYSPIYSQPISIGERLTNSFPKHPLEGIDLQNLPLDPAEEVTKACGLSIKNFKQKP
jgi:hypothetical protein